MGKSLERQPIYMILPLVVSAFFLYGAYSEYTVDKQWGVFMSFWFLLVICLGLLENKLYKIVYEGGTITWTRPFRKKISISTTNIAKVAIRSFFWRSPENPCISIFDKDGKEIRIGINYFKDSEIRWLLEKIHEYRPDLPLPKMWQRYYFGTGKIIES